MASAIFFLDLKGKVREAAGTATEIPSSRLG
jgi:hypothetical protein